MALTHFIRKTEKSRIVQELTYREKVKIVCSQLCTASCCTLHRIRQHSLTTTVDDHCTYIMAGTTQGCLAQQMICTFFSAFEPGLYKPTPLFPHEMTTRHRLGSYWPNTNKWLLAASGHCLPGIADGKIDNTVAVQQFVNFTEVCTYLEYKQESFALFVNGEGQTHSWPIDKQSVMLWCIHTNSKLSDAFAKKKHL